MFGAQQVERFGSRGCAPDVIAVELKDAANGEYNRLFVIDYQHAWRASRLGDGRN